MYSIHVQLVACQLSNMLFKMGLPLSSQPYLVILLLIATYGEILLSSILVFLMSCQIPMTILLVILLGLSDQSCIMVQESSP